MIVGDSVKKLMATPLDRVVTVTAAVLLVALGYLAGLWTAEARREAPIVFESSVPEDAVLSDADVQKLLEQTVRNDAGTGEDRAVAGGSGAVSGASEGDIVASVNGKKYYFSSCREISRIKEENRITFATEQEARDAGYEPSACVLKGEGQ